MKTFTKFFKIIAIVAVIALGFNACASTAEKYEAAIKTPEGKALQESLQKAKWKAKELGGKPKSEEFYYKKVEGALFGGGDAKELIKLDFFSNTLGTRSEDPKLNVKTWYALTASDFQGITYFYYKKDEKNLEVYECNDELSAYQKALYNAKWQTKKLDNPPSLNGFTRIKGLNHWNQYAVLNMEADYISNILGSKLEANIWYVITAPEFPGVTYYYYDKQEAKAMSVANIYKQYIKESN